ncbi:MAG: Asp-tRNA(Asn)/Glu-tRNA(Gln) amidotransferase subunit GatB [Vampirovibrionales bacterium]|nr:Asp-tRNA(Asn)/Glu-tRNA(Gln) amidotransferase subunit GatB [Vampirovibrionales bacterium]
MPLQTPGIDAHEMDLSRLTPDDFEPVIGLEVHVQLKTHSKLFSTAPNHFGDAPNTNITPLCLGLPGTLPVLNGQALEYAIRLGLALNCNIAALTKFDRKQYFYPDLPKAYQISQYDEPVCEHGFMDLSNGRHVRILRAHLEEDAGKLVHAGADGLAGSTHSLADYNRAGTPLLEIVTEPDITTADEAREYLTRIRMLARYLGVSDGNMEEGSMRCDANVSVRLKGQTKLGTKAEVKNMNSFRSVQRAIDSEIARQINVILKGGRVVQESRLWNEATGTTAPMRSKEEAHDYRYFPEPDLPLMAIDAAWVETLRQTQPELPEARLRRLQSDFSLSEYDASVLVEFKELGDAFLSASKALGASASPELNKLLVNWLQGEVAAYLKTEKLALNETKLTPESLAELAQLVASGELSNNIAKKVLATLLAEGGMPSDIIASQGLAQVSDEGALKAAIDQILADNAEQVAAYRGGKDKLFGFFVGQAMKATQGRANPEALNRLLKAALEG